MNTWFSRLLIRFSISAVFWLMLIPITTVLTPHRPTIAQPQIITWISQFWKRSRKPLGVRAALCPISPGLIESLQIVHDRPIFAWGNGDVVEVNLRQRGKTEIRWQGKPKPGDRAFRYDGPIPLEPGLYQWQIIASTSQESDRQVWKSFSVMPIAEQKEIQAKLKAFQDSLKIKGYGQEEMVLQTADFFADRQLWSDAIQVLLSFENPSPEFLEERQNYLQRLCTERDSV